MGQRNVAAIIRFVVIRIPDGCIDPVTAERSILRIDPDAILVPGDDFIPGVACDVQNVHRQIGMAIVGEHHHPAQVAIDHATLFRASGEQDEFLTVSPPVHGQHHASAMDGFVLREYVPIPIEQGDDAGISPEIYRRVLQSRNIGPILTDAWALRMPYPNLLQDVARLIEHDEPFIAAACISARFSVRVATEIAHRNPVGMVMQILVVAPLAPACVVPKRVADQQLVTPGVV